MKRNKPNVLLFDSQWYLNFDYKDYVAECEDNGKTPCEENSDGYWKWIYNQTEMEWDDFLDNIKYSEYYNCPFMITGTLGLWMGNRDILPVYCNNLYDAITKCLCCSSINDWDIHQENGYIVVNAHHHDGTNSFEIHLLSKKGMNEVERNKYLYEDYEPKPYWFKNIYGYII